MLDEDLCYLSIADAAALIAARQLSPVELTRAVLARVLALNPRVNAYITVMAEAATLQASQAEAAVMGGGYLGPLHGIPMGLKDLFDTGGVRTTAGSKLLAERVPEEDAAVVARLKGAGAIIVGKLNMHEFAYGITNENPHYGAARNPWDLDRITGGSSGGSGAATAAGMCVASLGTDTGGSIRIPACFCGIVGLKPTYGRVSRRGVVPLSPTLDHVGPMTRTVEDAAIVLQAIAGHDPNDPGSLDAPVPDLRADIRGGLRGTRVGVMGGFITEPMGPGVKQAVTAAFEKLEGLGASVEPVELPFQPQARMVNGSIISAEAASYHQTTMESNPGDYDPATLERLAGGRRLLATSYVQALESRRRIRDQLLAVMDGLDLLALPMEPLVAPLIGGGEVTLGRRTTDVRGAVTKYTGLFNLTGFPAISLPCGFTPEGLPVGFQLVAKPLEEAALLRAAYAYEEASGWGQRRPPL
jgi:aspartyl-tRNA(Asn)/glutamyl-tRNA(Gln) amidotransferase subunit A